MLKRLDEKDHDEECRKNAQSPLNVKASPVESFPFAVEKNSCNQKAGEHEKQEDSEPSEDKKRRESRPDSMEGRGDERSLVKAMIQDDGENRDSAQDIKAGHVLSEQRRLKGLPGRLVHVDYCAGW
jgi:hypothetical protein